jgi:hypothetical protein
MYIPAAPLYGQELEHKDFKFNLKGGTSAPCPSPELFSLGRPDPPGVPTRVGIGLYFDDILALRDTEQTFTADVWLVLRWQDPRLADPSRGDAWAKCEFPIDNVWNPKFTIRNLREVKKEDDIVLIDAEGYFLLFRRMSVTVFSTLDLREFPFDRQVLTLTVSSLLGSDEVVFEVLEGLVGQARKASVTSWTLGAPRARIESQYAKVSQVRRTDFVCHIEATREPGFYTRKLIIPLTLIVFMAWAIFWIKPEMTAPQMGVGTTAMLTLIAYHFALSGFLPRISYLTRADSFLLWSLILVFTALMEAIATAAFVNFGKEVLALKMDRIFRVAYPLAFLLIIGVTIL